MNASIAQYADLPGNPFIAWLDRHGLLNPGAGWEATVDAATGQHTYRRTARGTGWPKDKVYGPLVVRPKRAAGIPPWAVKR